MYTKIKTVFISSVNDWNNIWMTFFIYIRFADLPKAFDNIQQLQLIKNPVFEEKNLVWSNSEVSQ